jgi:hypothetical protein
MTSLKRYLESRGLSLSPEREAQSFAFTLRARLWHGNADLKKSAGTKSPGAWAYHLGVCATALNNFSTIKEHHGREAVDRKAQFFEITPERLIDNMAEFGKKTKEAVTQYYTRGIDPQPKITVMPAWNRATGAIKRWGSSERTGL